MSADHTLAMQSFRIEDSHATDEETQSDFSSFVYQTTDTSPRNVIKAERSRVFLPPTAELAAVDKFCDDTQRRALAFIVEKAKALHDKALPELRDRVRSLKVQEKGKGGGCFTSDHLSKALLWIRDEAPIIIHIPLEADGRIDKLLNDTHFRNQFETKISRGTLDFSKGGSRASWESRLFNKEYDDALPFQRPKYGCLNIVNDPAGMDGPIFHLKKNISKKKKKKHTFILPLSPGIECATCYGESYLILKGCRLRTTFADRDSSCENTVVASCEYHAHVLAMYADEELRRVLEVANRMRLWRASDCIYTYKEVQIHGEIRLSDNVDIVVLAKDASKEPGMRAKVQQFCKKNSCHYVVRDDTFARDSFDGNMWAAVRGAPASKPAGFLDDPYSRLPSFIVNTESTGEEIKDKDKDKDAPKAADSKKGGKKGREEEEEEVSFCMDDFFAYGTGLRFESMSTEACGGGVSAGGGGGDGVPPSRVVRMPSSGFGSSFCMDDFFAFDGRSPLRFDAAKPSSLRFGSSSFCMDDFFAYGEGKEEGKPEVAVLRRDSTATVHFGSSSFCMDDFFAYGEGGGKRKGAADGTSAKVKVVIRPPGFGSSSFCMDDFFAYGEEGVSVEGPAAKMVKVVRDTRPPGFGSSSFCMDDFFAYGEEGEGGSVKGPATTTKVRDTRPIRFDSSSFCMDDFFAYGEEGEGGSVEVRDTKPPGFGSSSFCMDDFFAYGEGGSVEGPAVKVKDTKPIGFGSSSFCMDDFFAYGEEGDVGKPKRMGFGSSSFCMDDFFAYDGADPLGDGSSSSSSSIDSSSSCMPGDLFGCDSVSVGKREEPELEISLNGWACPDCTYVSSFTSKCCGVCGYLSEEMALREQRAKLSLRVSQHLHTRVGEFIPA